jgi:hypothetical protein
VIKQLGIGIPLQDRAQIPKHSSKAAVGIRNSDIKIRSCDTVLLVTLRRGHV